MHRMLRRSSACVAGFFATKHALSSCPSCESVEARANRATIGTTRAQGQDIAPVALPKDPAAWRVLLESFCDDPESERKLQKQEKESPEGWDKEARDAHASIPHSERAGNLTPSQRGM